MKTIVNKIFNKINSQYKVGFYIYRKETRNFTLGQRLFGKYYAGLLILIVFIFLFFALI